MPSRSDLFPASYAASRARFCGYLARIQRAWPAARLVSRPLDPAEELTLDWIEAEPRQAHEKVILFTLGEHGIEGFVGSAMLELFVTEFLPALDPRTTGLVLMHALNPWGMAHHRRVNRSNVDLNRNFVWDETWIEPSSNPDYRQANWFLNPPHPVGSRLGAQFSYATGMAGVIARLGVRRFRQAVTLGQYAYHQGIYYGGNGPQEETCWAIDLYRQAAARYAQILLLDMHTGYGPRERMSLVNSVFEPRSSAELCQAFGYPDIAKTDPSEFYAIQGDMIDYLYTLVKNDAPGRQLYAASFEFGTFGDSFTAGLRSVRGLILENQAFWHGANGASLRAWIDHEFGEMFFPQDPAWQVRAVQNARAAFQGILTAENFI